MFNVIKGEFINRNNNPVFLEHGKKNEDINKNQNNIDEGYEEDIQITEKREELERILNTIEERTSELQKLEIIIKEREKEAEKNLEALEAEAKKKMEYEYKVSKESGYRDGYQAGENEAREIIINKSKEMFARIINLVEDAQNTREQILKENEEYIIALAIKIAQKIIREEVKLNKDIIRNVIGNAIKKVPISRKMTVIVNWEDLEYIKEIKQSIFSEIKGVENIEIIEDQRIHRGGCVLETSIGTIDATIESQLEAVEEAFLEIKENSEAEEIKDKDEKIEINEFAEEELP